MSDTPRTDAAIFRVRVEENPPAMIAVVEADVACQLERENAALHDELDAALIILQQIAGFATPQLEPTPEARMARAFLAELAQPAPAQPASVPPPPQTQPRSTAQ